MAGSPKKRARKAEEMLRKTQITGAIPTDPIGPDATIPEAIAAPPEFRPESRTREPRTPPRTRPRATNLGPTTRDTIDRIQSDEIARLSRALRPGLILSIERTRPSYAAGWVGDYEQETASLAELRAHLAEEHGGQVYRVSVMDPGGIPLFTSTLRISGPPRREGRVWQRHQWEGREKDPDLNPPPPPPPRDSGLAALGEIFQGLLNMNANANKETLRAVQELNARTSQHTSELIAQIVNQRADERRPNFVETLREVAAANDALRDVREAIAADRPEPVSRAEQENVLEAGLKDAARSMFSAAIQKEIGRRQPPAGPPPRPPGLDIPEAIRDPGPDGRRPPDAA